MKAKLISIATLLVLCINTAVAAFNITGTSGIVLDASSGNVYYEKNADEPLAPASMTKIMTAYIIYEEMDKGLLSKDTMITADHDDYIASIDPEATNVYLAEGMAYSVDELLGAIMVPSACAASAMAGKYISGSEPAFAQRMTETARKMGLDAYFEDASGLSDNNRITARSMALLTKAFITKYPDILNYTLKPSITWGEKVYKSTNYMLNSGKTPYWGVTGLKTGTTTLAGSCFTATAMREDIQLISVTMHSIGNTARFNDTRAMLDFGFTGAYSSYKNLYSTALRVYINDNEIPAYCYKGKSNYLTILAEDLVYYGFDVNWDNDTASLSVMHNPYNSISPKTVKRYEAHELDMPVLPILSDKRTVTVDYMQNRIQLSCVHPLNGYIAISADELAAYSRHSVWDGNSNSLYLYF